MRQTRGSVKVSGEAECLFMVVFSLFVAVDKRVALPSRGRLQQNRDNISEARHAEVEPAVGVEICGHNLQRSPSGFEGKIGLECTVTIAQQGRNSLAAVISKMGHHEVEGVVAVEVAHRDLTRAGGGGIVHVRLERAVAVAKKDGGGAIYYVSGCEIQLPIVV